MLNCEAFTTKKLEGEMPGKRITKEQVKIYMETRKSGKTQLISSAKAGISERSGRAIEKGGL